MQRAMVAVCLGLAGCLPIAVALRSQVAAKAEAPVVCATTDECEAAWGKAVEFVSQRCAFEVKTQSEDLIETEGPLPGPSTDVACRVERIPAAEAGSSRLEITARCGNFFECDPETLYLRAAFHEEVRAAIAAKRASPGAPAGVGIWPSDHASIAAARRS